MTTNDPSNGRPATVFMPLQQLERQQAEVLSLAADHPEFPQWEEVLSVLHEKMGKFWADVTRGFTHANSAG